MMMIVSRRCIIVMPFLPCRLVGLAIVLMHRWIVHWSILIFGIVIAFGIVVIVIVGIVLFLFFFIIVIVDITSRRCGDIILLFANSRIVIFGMFPLPFLLLIVL